MPKTCRKPPSAPGLWRSDSFYSIAEMVADDLGWAILPVNVGTDDAYDKPLQQVSCPSLALSQLSVRVLWREGWEPPRRCSGCRRATRSCWVRCRRPTSGLRRSLRPLG